MRTNSLALCGFMGCGKTTAGKLLAQELGFRFLDTDRMIEDRLGMTVPDIFAKHGEACFRKEERALLAELSAMQQSAVIATGGGMLVSHENAACARKFCAVVFIDVPLDTILDRLKGDQTRPLLASGSMEETAAGLYRARRPLYLSAAHFSVDGEGSVREVTEEIIMKLKQIKFFGGEYT